MTDISVFKRMLGQPYVPPRAGIPLSSNIGLIFTAVSIARSFALRRFFEARRVRGLLP